MWADFYSPYLLYLLKTESMAHNKNSKKTPPDHLDVKWGFHEFRDSTTPLDEGLGHAHDNSPDNRHVNRDDSWRNDPID